MSFPPAASGPERFHRSPVEMSFEAGDLPEDNLRWARPLGHESLRDEVLLTAGLPWLGAYILTSPDLRAQARQLHGKTYAERGYVTSQGLRADGTLIPAIDPPDVVDSAQYIGIFHPTTGKLEGGIRLVADELPTMTKLQKVYEEDPAALSAYPFHGARIFEGSALAHIGTDPKGFSRLFIATVTEAQAQGFEYGVVGLVDKVAHRVIRMFGDKAFRRIGDDSKLIHLKGRGLRPTGITLVPCYIEVDTFVRDCLEFFQEDPLSVANRIYLPLFEKAVKSMPVPPKAAGS